MSQALLLLSSSIATLHSSFSSLFGYSVAAYPERSEGSHSSKFTLLFCISRKLILPCLFFFLLTSNLFSQTKQTETVQQTWFGYFNQTRFSNKWGTWTDIHLRTKEDFVSGISQSILRLGLTYYRSEEHTSELQSQSNLVCRLLLEKKKKKI